jgi:hypothetical protein
MHDLKVGLEEIQSEAETMRKSMDRPRTLAWDDHALTLCVPLRPAASGEPEMGEAVNTP